MCIILNPHVSDFYFEPISYRLIKRRALKKYNYVFNTADSGAKMKILIDGSGTGMIPMGLFLFFPKFLRMLICRIEISWWLKINKLKGKVDVFYKKEKLDPNSFLFAFAYKIFQAEKNLVKTANYFHHAVFHLSHYHGFTKEMSSALSKINNCYLAADADIADRPFFRHYFSWYSKPVLILPFEVGNRFKITKPLGQRLPKAIAMGTFHRFDEASSSKEKKILREYVSFTKANELHPVRRQIFENPGKCGPYIDSMISPYIEKRSNFFSRAFKTFFSQQKKYFSFDIVAKYNEYLFAVVGEELHNGLPGIGAFEAMASGCVLIGNSCCYKGLGMTDNEQYLAYEGDLDVLLNKIKEAQALPKEQVEYISEAGRKYVQENFYRDPLCKRFIHVVSLAGL